MTENDDKQDLGNDLSKFGALQPKKLQPIQPAKTDSNRNAWWQKIAIPKWLSLAAILLAAFLFFPAYKGFTSGREIRSLKEESANSNHALSLSRAQITKLENDLYQVGFQGRGRRVGDRLARGLGLFVSPVLSLEQKNSRLPDLIHIDFRNKEEAVLAFELTRFNIEELQMSIFQEGNLVWLQTILIPPKTLFVQNLVTFVLSRDTLAAGEYRIKIEGNPSRVIKPVGEFDLTVER